MAKNNAYPPEFRRQMVDLVRAGRNPEELSREFEPSAGAIRNWVRQADLDEGRREDVLTSFLCVKRSTLLGRPSLERPDRRPD